MIGLPSVRSWVGPPARPRRFSGGLRPPCPRRGTPPRPWVPAFAGTWFDKLTMSGRTPPLGSGSEAGTTIVRQAHHERARVEVRPRGAAMWRGRVSNPPLWGTTHHPGFESATARGLRGAPWAPAPHPWAPAFAGATNLRQAYRERVGLDPPLRGRPHANPLAVGEGVTLRRAHGSTGSPRAPSPQPSPRGRGGNQWGGARRPRWSGRRR